MCLLFRCAVDVLPCCGVRVLNRCFVVMLFCGCVVLVFNLLYWYVVKLFCCFLELLVCMCVCLLV